MDVYLFPISLAIKCDTAISILESENKMLEAMMNSIYDTIQNDSSKNSMIKLYLEDVTLIIKGSILVNDSDIMDYKKLKALMEKEEYDPLCMGMYINTINRRVQDHKKRIKELCTHKNGKSSSKFLDEVVAQRLKTENKLLKLSQDFLCECGLDLEGDIVQ